MRLNALTRTVTASVTLAALTMAFGAVPARAGDDDVPFDTKIIRSILGELGLKRGDEPTINYQERGPLVLPPGKDLPPPASSSAAVAANPAWPRDPDIARAKADAERERTRNIEAEIELEQNQHMTEAQMTPGARNNPALARRVSKTKTTSTGERRMAPSELGYLGDLFSFNNMFGNADSRNAVHFTGEPQRNALTDPPAGYQIPSPAQPYGVTKGRVAPQATDYYGTHGVIDSSNQ